MKGLKAIRSKWPINFISLTELSYLKSESSEPYKALKPLKPFYLSVSLFTCHHAGTSTQSEQRIKRARRA